MAGGDGPKDNCLFRLLQQFAQQHYEKIRGPSDVAEVLFVRCYCVSALEVDARPAVEHALRPLRVPAIRHGVSRYFGMTETDASQRQEWQIVQP